MKSEYEPPPADDPMSLAYDPNAKRDTPVLHPGDRLNRVEFERRYQAMPDCKKAELIEGIVYMPSPTRLDHGQPHALLTAWTVHYSIETPGTDYADNATNRLDAENEPQPDVALFVDAACGGQSRVSIDGYLTGPVEFVGEVSVSSVALDRGPKLRIYERHRVKEYLIWSVENKLLEWYALKDDGFELCPLPVDGIYRSIAFPGLWLDAVAMLKRDGPAVMRTLRQGLSSPEHANFVGLLKKRRG